MICVNIFKQTGLILIFVSISKMTLFKKEFLILKALMMRINQN